MPDPTRDAIEHALARLVQEQGQWIARDPVRVRTLLQHTFANSPVAQTRELEAAVAAVEYGVFDVLSTATTADQVDGFVNQLDTQRGLTTDEARWAVTSWAHAAGLPIPGGAATEPSRTTATGTVPIEPQAQGGVPGAAPFAAGAAAPAMGLPPPGQPPADPTAAYPQQPQQPGYPPQPGYPQPPAPPTYPPPAQPQPSPPPGYPSPGGPPPAPPGYGAAGGYPPPGAPPPGAAPGGGSPSGGGNSSRVALLVGIAILAFVVIIGAIAFFATRGGEQEVVSPPTTATESTKKPTTTTEDDTTTSRRSTTTKRSTTTTNTEPTTTTEPPLVWQPFVDPNGRYSVEFPGSPQLEQTSTQIDGQNIGIFSYKVNTKGITYELAVLELPPGYYFPNPQSTLETLAGRFISSEGGSITARDSSAFAGLPAIFLAVKKGDVESNIFGLIAGNRIYFLDAAGNDFSNADFPRFRNSFQLR
ncbi:MAG: hypothetical protein HYX32_01625 [Actinobacteria bacterium]|nr:hypothetical protein [Actinomycetota bacterium]